jgi:RNA polymerase sigma-70 factor (ECF subfamily)
VTVDRHEDFLNSALGAMDLVYNIARRMVPSVEDARDLVQETYLSAFAAWTKGRKPDRVEPWLATICLNLARSSYRRRSHRPHEVPLEGARSLADPSNPERAAIASLEVAALRHAMWSLDEGQRIAITLVDIGGLSTAEAAAAMGTPRGTVLSRLHRGRRSLALLLEDQVKEREP